MIKTNNKSIIDLLSKAGVGAIGHTNPVDDFKDYHTGVNDAAKIINGLK